MTSNLTPYGEFCAILPEGTRVLVTAPVCRTMLAGEPAELRTFEAVMGDDGNAWRDGVAFCHPQFGDRDSARRNSLSWSVAEKILPKGTRERF